MISFHFIWQPRMAAALASSLSLLRTSRLALPYATRCNAFSHLSLGSLAASFAPLRPQRFVRHITASSNEEAAAKNAVDTSGPTIFDKIIAKEIPSDIVYEDDNVLAFRDINPQAPVHILIIPKLRDGLTQLSKAEARHCEILGQLLYASKIVAEKEGIAEGFRVVINNGPDACQSVYHLHLHVIGGRQLKWPPG
ncbi:Histidine triad nucleotide-binding protein [Rhynchospora pubera]|uniref:Histidine triad nucleotide-binding protein n=1 Tax=Rhynchospora pubera TaxID=906938 RepID=A0AAV8BYH3_9POAL|nr:Histidine triad nucleotide-binding protein [Rhynchospora pubera]